MRQRRSQTRVIAYAMPQPKRQTQALWAAAAGLLTTIVVYAVAALLS